MVTSNPREISYPLAITPAVIGILVGAAITSAFPGRTALDRTYLGLPEFHLWRLVMVAQVSVYVTVAVFLWSDTRARELPRLPVAQIVMTTLLTTLVVLLPNLLERIGDYPNVQYRMLAVVGFGLVAILILMHRVARLFAAFRATDQIDRHMELRRMARDHLMLAGLVVTLATLGSSVLQLSLSAMDAASASFSTRLTRSHVLAYGGYFTLVLFLFFAPLLVVERQAAVRIARAQRTKLGPDTEKQLGLSGSLAEHIASAFGLLSPLLGALASRLLG